MGRLPPAISPCAGSGGVVPAQAGTQCLPTESRWIPAFAGMTLAAGELGYILQPRAGSASALIATSTTLFCLPSTLRR